MTRRTKSAFGMLAVAVLGLVPGVVRALEVKKSGTDLAEKEFFKRELYLSSRNVAAETVEGLSTKGAWDRFAEAYGRPQVFLDPRSGTASNVLVHIPLIPGSGVGNRLGAEDVGRSLGRKIEKIDGKVVGDLVRRLIVSNREAIGIDPSQLGSERVDQVTSDLWQISIPQSVDGIPVRYGRIAATISHGNLVLMGTESWGNVNLDTRARITADQATAIGFSFVGGRALSDSFWKTPMLEIVPVAPAELEAGGAFAGPMGAGYRHRLVWAFGFTRAGEHEAWELLVDAHAGEVLALEDRNQYEARKIVGGAYPLTNTGICPSNDRCGTMQSSQPMPFANTGLPAPDAFTNSAGLYNFSGTPATTTFSGKYVLINDACGAVSATSASGEIDLGGTNGDHDCTTPPGASAGNTAASRSAFYEVNKLIEMARGWLPLNTWLTSQVVSNMNINQTCNAFYNSDGSINFYRSGGGCRNTGEIAAVFDHEWGHALDDNDSNGFLSASSEAYADITAIYRLQASCMGAGFFETFGGGCGVTSDGTGNNANESILGTHCDLDCNGVRDCDWDKHADHTPDTPQNFSCIHCIGGGGPCGLQVHCDAAPSRQAAWDFVARDLRAAPFNLGTNDAFIVGNKVFYQGSGNIGSWHACTCPGTSDGCGATNAYMQWLAADDDDGNVANGTPHMTALFAAFNRHNIACASPAPLNSGCSGAPTAAPNLTASIVSNGVNLSWPAVPGASTYRVLRSEGYAGCDFGKAVIANVAGTSYSDTDVANGRAYSYVVQAVGSTSACFGPGSTCVTASPQPCSGVVSLTSTLYNCTGSMPLVITLVDSDLTGSGSRSVSISSDTEPGPETKVLNESPPGSGVFTGTFNTTASSPVPGDGAISVSNGDTIAVEYIDASFCGTPNVTVTKLASVDCVGPAISNVRAQNVTGNSADIRWDTTEGSTSRVSYGLTIPPGTQTPVDPALIVAHSLALSPLQECSTYHYAVDSTDAASNTVLASNGGAYFTFVTGKNVNPTYPYAGSPVSIPDNNPVGAEATVNVPEVNTIVDADVMIHVTHTFDGDLLVKLIAPDATEVILASHRGAGGHDFNNTVFDDEAATPIAGGNAPFAGAFRPDQPLSALDGKNPNGIWRLKIVDESGLDTGTIDAWQLRFAYPPQACGASLKYLSNGRTDACNGSGSGSGNTVVEPGETIALPVTIQNDGTAATTGVTASLRATTPGVTVTGDSSSYPNLSAGQSAFGATPFQIQVGPGVSCGTTIGLRLDMTANEGAWTSTFTLPVGALGTGGGTSSATDVPKTIADLATVSSVLGVPATETVTDVNVGLSITHTYDGDLVLTLIGPNGTRVVLSNRRGIGGDNFNGTIFDDEATAPIASGAAPFSGAFKPDGVLSSLDGLPANGTWTLEVQDASNADTGALAAWSLTLTMTGPPICNLCTPSAQVPPEVATLTWTGHTALGWTSAAGATSYELYRGEDADLAKLLNASNDSCERMETASLSSGPVLTENPVGHRFRWFLVRGRSSAGVGPAGGGTLGSWIQNGTGVCP